MNHPSGNTIIREIGGTFDSKYESEVPVTLQKSSSKLLPRLTWTAIPALNGTTVRYLVPTGNLRTIIEMDGAPMRIRVAGTSSDSHVIPQIKIKGVVENSGGALIAAFLHGYVDDQIPRLREGIKAIFESLIPAAMSATRIDALQCNTDEIETNGEPIKEDDLCREIRSSVANTLGLLVTWNLAPLEEPAEWLERLRDRVPKFHKFTPEHPTQSAAVSYKVGLSFQAFRPSRYASLILWSNQRKDPGVVAQEIIARLGDIISEQHASKTSGRPPHDDRAAAERLADEFGVELRVETFETVWQMPRASKRSQQIESTLDKVYDKYHEAIANGEDISSRPMLALKASIDALTESLGKNEEELRAITPRGGFPHPGPNPGAVGHGEQITLDRIKDTPPTQGPRLPENHSDKPDAGERDS